MTTNSKRPSESYVQTLASPLLFVGLTLLVACASDPPPPPLPRPRPPEKVGGNKTRAAEILRIDPSTIGRREKQGKT